jgi:ribosomal protein S3
MVYGGVGIQEGIQGMKMMVSGRCGGCVAGNGIASKEGSEAGVVMEEKKSAK